MKYVLNTLAVLWIVLASPLILIFLSIALAAGALLLCGFKYSFKNGELTMKGWINPSILIRISKHQVLVHANGKTKLMGTVSY